MMEVIQSIPENGEVTVRRGSAQPSLAVHTCNLIKRVRKEDNNSRPSWATDCFQEQPGKLSKALPQKKEVKIMGREAEKIRSMVEHVWVPSFPQLEG